MGQIKSALELALERTKDVKADKEALEAKGLKEEGMKLIASFLADGSSIDLEKELSKYTKTQLLHVHKGIKHHLFSTLSLPNDESSVIRLERLGPVFLLLSQNHGSMVEYMGQLPGFYRKYLDNKAKLLEAVQAKFEPVLRRKEEAMTKQTGRKVTLTFEQDQEFMAFLNQNMENLNDQFNQILDQIKSEIEAILGNS